MGTVIKRVTLRLPANKQAWTRANVPVVTGQVIKILSSGSVTFGHSNEYAWPEGTYPDRTNPIHAENVGATLDYDDDRFDGAEDRFVVGNTAPEGISMLVLPVGEVPPTPANNSVMDAYRVTRDYTLDYSLATGEIWLIFNDVFGAYANNTGEFTLTISVETDDPLEIDIGQPSPLHYCPPGMALTQRQHEFERVWMVAIKPLRGAWEHYTEYDLPLEAPAYTDELGNTTPAGTYLPVVADLSNIPRSLKMSSEGVDVKILAPQFLQGDYIPPEAFLDRVKLVNGYHIGAYWELFTVDPTTSLLERQCWGAGEIGNSQLDDLTATIELTSFDEMANRDVGEVHHNVCQVGTWKNEKFATLRCAGLVLSDGPQRDDWTVLATIEEIGWSTLRLSHGDISISAVALDADFDLHLANGDIEFLDDDEVSGINAGFEMTLVKGTQVLGEDELPIAGLVDVQLRLSLKNLPAVGDQLHLVAGCRRNKGDCIFFNNLPNMQASDLAGQEDLLRRTRV